MRSAAYANSTCSSQHRSTGKERDTESGNDYFEASYYASSMGRFMSPDWSAKEDPVPYATMDDPQSLNLYSYVRNNPLARTDPDGHCCEDDFKSFQTPEQANYFHQAPDNMDHQFFGALGSFIQAAATFVAPELGLVSAAHDVANGNYGSAAINLAGAIPVGGLAKGAGILENAAKGAAGEAKVGQELVSEGKTILGSHVGVQTEEGLRVVDHLTQDAGKLEGVEVKTGGATRTASQVTKDNLIATKGGKIVGKNAPANLRGQTVKFPTKVRKPQP
jgi:RHS repeat-associated protein